MSSAADGRGTAPIVDAQQLPSSSLHGLLPQRLRDALRDPALRLAPRRSRVDDAARVVDGHVAPELDGARLSVDLDNCDMRSRAGQREVASGHRRTSAWRPGSIPSGRSCAVRAPKRGLLGAHRARPCGAGERTAVLPRGPSAVGTRACAPRWSLALSSTFSSGVPDGRAADRRGCGCRRCPCPSGAIASP